MRHKFPYFFGKMAVDIENPTKKDENHYNSGESSHSFSLGLRPVIILGRLFGVLSRTDVASKKEQKRRINIASILSACFAVFFVINAILLVALNLEKFQRDKTTLVRVEGFHHALYSCSMAFVYCYQLFATTKFRKIVQNFIHENLPDRRNPNVIFPFPRFCFLITITCLFLGMLENALFDYQNLTHDKRGASKASFLELSYKFYFNHWHVLLPHYNAVITVIFVVFIKLGTWGWVHIDTICIILCRALWEKLRRIEENVDHDTKGGYEEEPKLASDQLVCTQKPKQSPSPVNWDIYQDQYLKISQLVEEVEKYICPLILACYAGNIYIIIVMLFNWIGPLSSDAVSTKEQFIHICFAFFQYSFRVGAITHFAAEVHQQSVLIRRKIQSCPNASYSVSVERLEKTLVGNPTGICLLGSFVISRKYFISIISFIFTAEIVLLQTYSSYYVAQGPTIKRTN